MRKLVPFLLSLSFLFSANFLFSQAICDTAKAKVALARSVELMGKEETEPALDSALLALNALTDCPKDSTLFQLARSQAEKCCLVLANEFINKGLFNRAVDYSERGIAFRHKMSDLPSLSLSDAYMSLSRAHAMNGNHKLAADASVKGLAEREAVNPSDPGIPAFYEQIVIAHIQNGDTSSAHQYLYTWEQVLKKMGDKVTPENRIRIAMGWGMLYERQGDGHAAVKIIEDSLTQYGNLLKARRSLMTSIAEFQLCRLYTQIGNHDKVFEYADKNVVALETRLRQQKGKLFSRSHLGWYLAQSARAAWNIFLRSQDTSWYRIAEQRCTQAEAILFDMRDRAPDDGFRDWVANNAGMLAEVRQGLYAHTGERMHMERAFAAMEATKMFAVQQFLHETHALQWGGLSDSLYARETEFRNAVNELETNFFMFRMRPNADSLLTANDQKLFALRDKYRLFLADLEKNYPEYFRLKYSQPKTSLAQVQSELLSSNQCLLDLLIENKRVFMLLVRPDTALWLSSQLDSTLLSALDIMQHEPRRFAEYQSLPETEYLEHLRSFADASHRLYQALIEPLRPLLLEEILIIPRNQLASLPFGALLTQKETNMGKPFQWHFLDQQSAISQAYSVGLFKYVQDRPVAKKPSGSLLAIAPFYEKEIMKDVQFPVGDVAMLSRSNIFNPLPSSGEEARTIAQITKGETLLGSDATKATFLKKSPDFNILHLATHSVANDGLGEYSFVALQAADAPNNIEMLYARDIYNLRLSADLVVLSACETALGQYRNDDGIVGLTRAFICAGARNVVASLWSVNDASTKELMILFYKEIKKGEPYNRALANAKRAFIKENRQYAHPYYWAGFVLNGR